MNTKKTVSLLRRIMDFYMLLLLAVMICALSYQEMINANILQIACLGGISVSLYAGLTLFDDYLNRKIMSRCINKI